MQWEIICSKLVFVNSLMPRVLKVSFHLPKKILCFIVSLKILKCIKLRNGRRCNYRCTIYVHNSMHKNIGNEKEKFLVDKSFPDIENLSLKGKSRS